MEEYLIECSSEVWIKHYISTFLPQEETLRSIKQKLLEKGILTALGWPELERAREAGENEDKFCGRLVIITNAICQAALNTDSMRVQKNYFQSTGLQPTSPEVPTFKFKPDITVFAVPFSRRTRRRHADQLSRAPYKPTSSKQKYTSEASMVGEVKLKSSKANIEDVCTLLLSFSVDTQLMLC